MAGKSHAGRAPSLEEQIARVPKLTRKQLIEQWRSIFSKDPPEKISRTLMVGGIAYRLQARRLGGLTFSTRQELARVAAEDRGAEPRRRKDQICSGTILFREWRGES